MKNSRTSNNLATLRVNNDLLEHLMVVLQEWGVPVENQTEGDWCTVVTLGVEEDSAAEELAQDLLAGL